MKGNKQKIEIAMARSCLRIADVSKVGGIPVPSIKNVLSGRNVTPRTLGILAKALNVDAAEIIE